MIPTAIDTETHLITAPEPYPRMVCASIADVSGPILVAKNTAVPLFEDLLADGDIRLILQNAPFDLSVLSRASSSALPKIFRALDEGRISDTAIREKLLAIEDGTFEYKTRNKRFSLEAMSQQYLGVELDKGDTSWRLRYGELDGVPVNEWPLPAKEYALEDARSTLRVWRAQEEIMKEGYRPPDEVLQVRADWALGLMKGEWCRIDREMLNRYEVKVLKRAIAAEEVLAEDGLIRDHPPSRRGSVNKAKLQRMIVTAYEQAGLEAPRTEATKTYPAGQVKTDEETLKLVGEPNTALGVYAGYQHDKNKILGTYVWPMRDALERTAGHIRFGWRSLVETGRTSCGKIKIGDIKYSFNAQNPPREAGVRECLRPTKRDCSDRENVWINIDVDIAELKSLADICYNFFGFSMLREAFLRRQDPHVILASGLLGISPEEGHDRKKAGDEELLFVRNAVAKHMNFGLAGGMGASTFVQWVRGSSDLRLEEDRDVVYRGRTVPSARYLKQHWLKTWPEMHRYFSMIGDITGDGGSRKITQVRSGRVRGGLRFTSAANTLFQGQVADMMKDIMYRVARACYVVEHSHLYGCRPVLFLHDEFMIESPEEQAHDAAMETERIFHETQAEWMPSVPPGAEACLTRVWSKKAKRIEDKHGRLVPWDLTPALRGEITT